jgi:polyhydroxybutyrate depolymerase
MNIPNSPFSTVSVHIKLFLILCIGFILTSCAEDSSPVVEEVPTIRTGVIEATITVNNTSRSYILYVPANYTAESSVPLVFNFHGLGSNAFQQMVYGDFRTLADQEGFIVVQPNGTTYLGFAHWNVGGFTAGSTADDVGFTDALLTEISTTYNIDAQRVYATGMSNGGYMSFLLACQMNDKFAAVASVTGTMTIDNFEVCIPGGSMPVLQIHGTADATVSYEGTETWNKSIPDVLNFWVDINNCSPTPTITRVPDFNPNDDDFVDHYVYSGGTNGAVVEHYKINNGTHSWPGTTVGIANRTINATQLTWDFFKKYTKAGLIQ